jgi:single-strand DNA-binding protein
MAHITVSGNVGTDPEIKFYDGKNGSFGVARFSLAYTPREKDKMGNWSDGITTWFNISVVGKQAEIVADSIAKGQRVQVSGAFKPSNYTAKDGSQKQGLEIKAESITLELVGKKAPKASVQDDSDWGSNWNS